MKIKEIQNQEEWDVFIGGQPGAQFTQSWAWGEFQKAQGHRVIRLAGITNGTWQIAGQWIYHKKRLSGFWYAQRGPIIAHLHTENAKEMIASYIKAIKEGECLKGGLFLRVEPPIEIKQDEHPFSSEWTRVHAYQPAATMHIDLTKDEQELLDRMHEKTRYNTRLAERKGVTVRTSITDQDIDAFLALNQETAERDRFVSRSNAYIAKTIKTLRDVGMCKLRIAEHEGEPLAMSVEIAYGDTATYLYGASSSKKRNLMAPFALHWSAIKSAKQDGHAFYDLYGVNPKETSSFYYKKTWEGITRFKKGWGGTQIEYIGTWELPLRPFIYRLLQFIRK